MFRFPLQCPALSHLSIELSRLLLFTLYAAVIDCCIRVILRNLSCCGRRNRRNVIAGASRLRSSEHWNYKGLLSQRQSHCKGKGGILFPTHISHLQLSIFNWNMISVKMINTPQNIPCKILCSYAFLLGFISNCSRELISYSTSRWRSSC